MKFTKLLVVTLLGTLLMAGSTMAATKEKEIKNKFDINKNLHLKISNRYGKVQIKTWDKDQAQFRINISVESKTGEKAKKMLENINVDFTKGSTYINAETILGDFFTMRKLGNALFSGGKVNIDYMVIVPSYLKMQIIHKDGDLFMDSHSGELNIELSNGELTAHTFSGDSKIKLRSVKAKIDSLGVSNMDLGKTDLTIIEANKIVAESHDSHLNINSVETLSLRSSRDKVAIDQVEFLYGSSSMSKFEVNMLGDELKYDLKLGHMNIFSIHKLFNFIKVDSKFADLGLNFTQDSYLDFNIRHKSVKLSYPPKYDLSQKKTSERNTYITSGKYGKGKSVSEVNIRANNCKIKIN